MNRKRALLGALILTALIGAGATALARGRSTRKALEGTPPAGS